MQFCAELNLLGHIQRIADVAAAAQQTVIAEDAGVIVAHGLIGALRQLIGAELDIGRARHFAAGIGDQIMQRRDGPAHAG